MILLGEEAIALLSDDSGGLLSSDLLASSDGNVEFQFVDLRD